MDCFNTECSLNGRVTQTCRATLPSSSCSTRKSHPPKKVKVVEKKTWNKDSVTVIYLYKDWCEVTGYKNGSIHPYFKLHKMIDHVLECGLKVMLLPHDNGVTLAIDDKPFYQR